MKTLLRIRYDNLLTDNGSQFNRKNQTIRKYCEDHINEKHIWTSVHHPQTMGKLSAFQKGLKRFLYHNLGTSRDRQDIDHSFLIAYGSEQTLLVPKMNERAAKEQFNGTVMAYKDPIKELKKSLKGKRVSVDGASIGFGFSERLHKFCSPQDVSEQLLKRRMIRRKMKLLIFFANKLKLK
jgi:hypothetical protein